MIIRASSDNELSPPSIYGKPSDTPIKDNVNNLSDTYSVYSSDVQPDFNQLARELKICDDECDYYSETDKYSLSLLINKFPRVTMDQGSAPNRCFAEFSSNC